MDRIQLIPDILDEIASYLPQTDLASLARTSPLFFLPATAKLWRNLTRKNAPVLLAMLDPLDKDFGEHRFGLYRECVRQVNLPLDDVIIVDMLAVALENRTCSQPLFPSVSELWLSLSPTCDAVDVDIIMGLIPPNAFDITIVMPEADFMTSWTTTPSWRNFLQWILAEMVKVGGRPKKLAILPPYDDSGYLDNWLPGPDLDLHAILPTLKGFTAPMDLVSVGLLSVLSKAPLLNHLDLRWCPANLRLSWDISCLQEVLDDDETFASLTSAMFQFDLRSLIVLMEYIKGPLEDLQLRLKVSSEDELRGFGTAMESIPSSVTKLLLHVDDFRDPAANNLLAPVFPFGHLGKLCHCSKMTEFRFRRKAYRSPMALSNDHLDNLASAWPVLRILEIKWLPLVDVSRVSSCGLQDPHGLTLAVLIPLSRHCPLLQILILDYISADVTFPITVTLPSRPRHSLELVVNRSSSVSNPQALASLLDMLWSSIIVPVAPREWRYSSDGTLYQSLLRCSRSLQDKSCVVGSSFVPKSPASRRPRSQ